MSLLLVTTPEHLLHSLPMPAFDARVIKCFCILLLMPWAPCKHPTFDYDLSVPVEVQATFSIYRTRTVS